METGAQPRCLTAPRLSECDGIAHGFATREGGVSTGPFASLNLGHGVGDRFESVAENLARFEAATGSAALFTVSQVHGADVVVVDAATDPARLRDTEADALVTDVPGLALAVRTADCVPILLAAPARRVVAAIHAGWRGTVAGIAARAVAAMAEGYGVLPEEVVGAIGPAIGRCCFEVGPEVAERFVGDLEAAVHRAEGARPHVDLLAANLAVLSGAGVAAGRIDGLNACTACDPARFYSHRRDRGRTGRHLSYIALR